MLRSVLIAALLLAAPAAAAAAPLPEVFALGQSRESGAVCEAARDYLDPLGQGAARAWRVRCRGYSVALGRIYQLPASSAATWTGQLAARAECRADRPAPGGLPARLSTCGLKPDGAPYVVFRAAAPDGTVTIVEGLAPLSDVLETAAQVALGRQRPPAATEVRTSAAQAEIAADFPNLGGLAAAEAAAAVDSGRLKTRGYVQNNEWRFDEAETAFRALVTQSEGADVPAAQRAEALLNFAMNVSNNGRFEEADAWFAEADAAVPPGDTLLRARALNAHALHERNRRAFGAAISLARQALALRASAAPTSASGPVAAAPAAGGPLEIDAALARRLNRPSPVQSQVEATRVSPAEQLAVLDAQAWQVIGTSLTAQGDLAGGRAALVQAQDILARSAAVGRLAVGVQARVEADLAALDLRQGRAADAVRRYDVALARLRTRHAGSAAEGAMLLELGRAQASAGQDVPALATFARAMDVFREQRGGLGASADAAQPYFDLLLRRIQAEPGEAGRYGELFFDAAETVVSSATAETVNRLAARVAAGDSAVAGLSRALEDARRRVRAAESQIASLQADGLYTGALRDQLDATLRTEQAEADALEARMVAANPRYNQLVAPGARAADVARALRPGEVYLRLLPLAGRTYGVLLTSAGARPYAVDLGRERLQAEVNRLRLALEPEETLAPFDVAASAALFERLFGPVRAQVLGARHLVYAPEGPLVSLPVSLLVTGPADVRRTDKGEPDYSKTPWLGRKVASSVVLSGASFLQSRAFAPSAASKPYIGFGDPDLPRGQSAAFASLTRSFTRRSAVLERVCGETRQALLNIERLPETAAEVRSIAAGLGTPDAVVTGTAFSDSDLRARGDLADYRVLYFATHGLLPQPDACVPEPALITSLAGGDSDALLDTSEILNLRIDADLVVLAACNTGGAGAGSDRTGLKGGGEALGGLARAMIYAGGRALVVSHWAVDSEASVRLMTGLFAAGRGSLAESLQASQAALQDDPRTSHPYFWAPFTLVGDGGRAPPAAARTVAQAN